MKYLVFIILFFTAIQVVAQDKNLIRESSEYPFKKSVSQLKFWLKYHKITIFSEINHSKEAKKVGLTLPKTIVFIVGNPKIGTLLMQENQDIALHLPLKILVKENNNGQTEIIYEKIEPLAVQYGLIKTLPIAKKIDNLMEKLIKNTTTDNHIKQ